MWKFVPAPAEPAAHEEDDIPTQWLKDSPQAAREYLRRELIIATAYIERSRNFAITLGFEAEYDLLNTHLKRLRDKVAPTSTATDES